MNPAPAFWFWLRWPLIHLTTVKSSPTFITLNIDGELISKAGDQHLWTVFPLISDSCSTEANSRAWLTVFVVFGFVWLISCLFLFFFVFVFMCCCLCVSCPCCWSRQVRVHYITDDAHLHLFSAYSSIFFCAMDLKICTMIPLQWTHTLNLIFFFF